MEEFLLDAVVLRILGHLALFFVVLKNSQIMHWCIYLWSHHFKQTFFKYKNHYYIRIHMVHQNGLTLHDFCTNYLVWLFFYLSRLNLTFLLSIFSLFKEESYPTNFLSQWYCWKLFFLEFKIPSPTFLVFHLHSVV